MNDEIVEKMENEDIRPSLKECHDQLTANKKMGGGFSLDASVIDVEEAGYGISTGDDILYTYGLDTCCGLVLCDDSKRVLFHLDGGITPEDVLKVTNKMQFKAGTKVFIAPGANKMEGNFDYIRLQEMFQKLGYVVEVMPLSATYGFVTVKKDSITIGSPIDKDKIRTISLMTKKQMLAYLKNILLDVKENMVNENNSQKK